MTHDRILPAQMAARYFSFRRHSALGEVRGRMKEYAKSPATVQYWQDVLHHLERIARVEPRIAEASPPQVLH